MRQHQGGNRSSRKWTTQNTYIIPFSGSPNK
nr:MAG TPA: hypothetical protein [Caudoviricetes sp.]